MMDFVLIDGVLNVENLLNDKATIGKLCICHLLPTDECKGIPRWKAELYIKFEEALEKLVVEKENKK